MGSDDSGDEDDAAGIQAQVAQMMGPLQAKLKKATKKIEKVEIMVEIELTSRVLVQYGKWKCHAWHPRRPFPRKTPRVRVAPSLPLASYGFI